MNDLYHKDNWVFKTTEKGIEYKLYRYTILYHDIPEPIMMDIEASGVSMDNGVITFYDKYGEDEAVFDEQDILKVTKHE